MDKWKIRQKVDLTRSGSGPNVWPDALMTAGDKQAHTWEITVNNAGEAASIAGAKVTAYFNRVDNVTVAVVGSVSGNVASVTLPQECYAIKGPLMGIFRLTTTDGTTLTLSVLRFAVGDGPYDAIVDPGEVIPSLEDLLAEIDHMEAATAAAEAATTRANTAASNADSKASTANTAAGNANAAADRLSSVGMTVEMLAPSAAPTATVTQTAKKTTFELGIPRSNLAYATFEVNEGMELLMHTPEGFAGINFALNNGEMEVIINGDN